MELLTGSGYRVTRKDYDAAAELAVAMLKNRRREGREMASEVFGSVVLNELNIPPTAKLLSEIEMAELAQYTWYVADRARSLLEEAQKEKIQTRRNFEWNVSFDDSYYERSTP